MLGGSLALCLDRDERYSLRLWDRKESVRDWAAANCPASAVFRDFAEGVREADIAVLCLPLPVIAEFLRKYAGVFPEKCVVTDIGSLKRDVVKIAARCKINFVGSHPMAGTEKSGCAFAFPELFSNADVFVCAPPGKKEAIPVADMWRAAGGNVVRITSGRHDALVARTSHVLHIIASALSLSILGGKSGAERRRRFAGCATGFRDTSRIASSNPAMWREIISGNAEEVLLALSEFENECAKYRRMIENGDFAAFEKNFATGKKLRDQWLEYKKNE